MHAIVTYCIKCQNTFERYLHAPSAQFVSDLADNPGNISFLTHISLFIEPNDESAANVDAAKTWREDREKFKEIAEKSVKKTLGL